MIRWYCKHMCDSPTNPSNPHEVIDYLANSAPESRKSIIYACIDSNASEA